MPDHAGRLRHLTAPRTIALGALWNMAGRIGPLVVAVLATPFLIDALGVARWGIFTLALSLVGIFGIFDFGVGRALTRLIADRLATGEEGKAADAVVTGIVLLTVLGAIGAAVMAILVDEYTARLPDLPPPLRREVLLSLYVLCASAPLVLLNAALWGVLSAFQRFAAANLVNTPIMAMYYLGPLAVLRFADSLVAVMLVLVACRLAMTVAYWRICLGCMPSLRAARLDWPSIRPVLRFGGWMTVSSIVWPATLYLDRFVIAAVLSAAATAYYATPLDLILRFSVVPIAVMQTAFPAITTSYRHSPADAARLFRTGSLAIATIVLPAALLVVGFAAPLLDLWIGAAFAEQSAAVLQLLGVGVLFMCLDSVPLGLLDGIGRPKVNAMLSLAALLLYIPVLFMLIFLFGIEGAALAWTLRVLGTYAARLALCARCDPAIRDDLRRLLPCLAAALLAVLAPLPPGTTVAAMVAGAALFTAVAWTRSLRAEERSWLLARLRRTAPP